MPNDIVVLDPSETESLLAGYRYGGDEMLTKIADNLMTVVDTRASVFVTDLKEANVNAIRTKMKRKDIRVSFRRTVRDGKQGYIMTARTISQ